MSGFNDISNNSGPGSAAEPSMEEILASIRRILKEDDQTGAAPVDIDDDVLVLDSTMVAKAPDMASATTAPAESELEQAHPDAPLTSYHNEMHIASEPMPMTQDFAAAKAPPQDEASPAPGFYDDTTFASDALDQTDGQSSWFEPAPRIFQHESYSSEPIRPDTDAPPPPPEPPAADDPPAATAPGPFHAEQPASPPDEADPERKMSEDLQPPPNLISEQATQSAQNSVGALVRSISLERAVAVSRGGVTIEDLVREEIRPMLKSWLDSHLPVLVERIVRAEIERVIDRSQL